MALLWTLSQQIHILLLLGAPEVDAVLQLRSHKSRVLSKYHIVLLASTMRMRWKVHCHTVCSQKAHVICQGTNKTSIAYKSPARQKTMQHLGVFLFYLWVFLQGAAESADFGKRQNTATQTDPLSCCTGMWTGLEACKFALAER